MIANDDGNTRYDSSTEDPPNTTSILYNYTAMRIKESVHSQRHTILTNETSNTKSRDLFHAETKTETEAHGLTKLPVLQSCNQVFSSWLLALTMRAV